MRVCCSPVVYSAPEAEKLRGLGNYFFMKILTLHHPKPVKQGQKVVHKNVS